LVDRVKVFFRLEVGAARAEGARSRRDDHDGFRTFPIEDIISNGVTGTVVDCVDSTVVLVGCQDLAAQGSEAHRHYSWSFKLGARAVDERGNSKVGWVWIYANLPDGAVLTRRDHVVAKCAHMVERNPGVIRCVA